MSMDMGLGFIGTYITAAEIVGKTPTLTIERVTLEEVESMKKDDGDVGRGMIRLASWRRDKDKDQFEGEE